MNTVAIAPRELTYVVDEAEAAKGRVAPLYAAKLNAGVAKLIASGFAANFPQIEMPGVARCGHA